MPAVRVHCLALLLVFLPATAPAGTLPDEFTLGRYVPGDCWLYIHRVHNPKAEFADRHWGRVLNTLTTSGIGTEFKELISAETTCHSDRARFDKFWQQTWAALRSVRWSDLTGREMVFAQRMTNPMLVPDLFFLCRPAPETAEANFAALKSILENLASLSEDMVLSQRRVRGIEVWSLNVADAPFAFHLFEHDGVVGIVMGRRALWHTLGLFRGARRGPGAIVDVPRFAEAMKNLPPPEDGIAYLDLKRLFADVQRGCEGMAGPDKTDASRRPTDKSRIRCRPDGGGIDSFLHVVVAAMKSCDVFDYVASSDRTAGRQRIRHRVVRLREDFASKPLGRVIGQPRPIERFERYIPAEATAFDVSCGPDWLALYEELLEFVRTSVPRSQRTLEWWARWQKEAGFDIREDVLNWLGRETVSYELPGGTVTAFGPAPEWVTMVRVKDPVVAADRVNAAIRWLDEFLSQRVGHGLIVSPGQTVKATGFQTVTHPMFMVLIRPTIGVSGDWLIIGSSTDAVNTCLDRLAGRNQTVLENPRFMTEGIRPDGPVYSVSFQDLTGLGSKLSQAMSMMQVLALSIPNEPDARPVKAMFATMARLAPALAQIDFLSATASASTFDGQAWTSRTVTTYENDPLLPATPAND